MNKDNISILGIFAHPDDEFIIGGLLTRAKNRGIETHLLCATRGENCRITNKEIMNEENKAEVRTKEFNISCEILGVSSYKFLELEDSKGNEWSTDITIEKIYNYINEVNADIVVTFDSNGGNGHPDHKAISNLTTEAFEKLDSKNKKLYYVTLLPSTIANKYMEKINLPDNVKEKLINYISTDDKNVTSIIELKEDELENKINILHNYKSQFPDENGNYYSMPLHIISKLSIFECYYLNDNCDKDIYDIVDML